MIINLDIQEAVLLVRALEKVDPTGLFLIDLKNRIIKVAEEEHKKMQINVEK